MTKVDRIINMIEFRRDWCKKGMYDKEYSADMRKMYGIQFNVLCDMLDGIEIMGVTNENQKD